MDKGYTLLVGAKISEEDIHKQLDVISKKEHINIKVNVKTGELEQLKTITTKGTDSMGRLVTVTEKFNKEQKSLGSYITDTTEKMGNATKQTSNLGKELSKTETKAKGLGQTFLDTTAKVFRFGLSTKIIGLFHDAVLEAKDAIFEFDEAMTEFKKVSDLSDESLIEYTNKLGEMGEEVYRSKTAMLESATEFRKTGASEEEASELARVAEMYRNIADEQISSGESAGFLTSQMKAFNFTAEESLHIIDAVNETSNNFAVSSSNISAGLSKGASAMAVLGNSFEETIGLLTSG